MEIRLARFLAIAIVIVVIGGLSLRGRARKLERQLAAAPPATPATEGQLDSARAVARAVEVYRMDHTANGQPAGTPRVQTFLRDTVGFLIELVPTTPGTGAHAAVRVRLNGEVELRRLGP